MKNKLIPKHQKPYKPLTLLNDATTVAPIVVPVKRKMSKEEEQRAHPGQIKVNGQWVIPKNEEVKQDNRTESQKQKDNRIGKYIYLKQQDAENTEKAITAASAFAGKFMPTQIVGAVARGLSIGDYFANGNNGIVTDNYAKTNPEDAETINFVGDFVLPFAAAKAVNKGTQAANYFAKNYTLLYPKGRLYSGIPLPEVIRKPKTLSYAEKLELFKKATKVRGDGSEEGVMRYKKATNGDDRFIAGEMLRNQLDEMENAAAYGGHGFDKQVDLEALANLRMILTNGTDPSKTFYTGSLSAKGGQGLNVSGIDRPYYGGPFILVNKTYNPTNPASFTHVLINDSYENELGAKLARQYQQMLLKEFPNVKSILYSEVKDKFKQGGKLIYK